MWFILISKDLFTTIAIEVSKYLEYIFGQKSINEFNTISIVHCVLMLKIYCFTFIFEHKTTVMIDYWILV